MSDTNKTESDLTEAALFFHEHPKPGKLEIQATKPLGNQRDLALAYSPGVAAPCLEIADNPALAASYTSRGNLVAVISNGTAVLGLGNIGPLASKPVMEGKAVLFKKFAGIDVFDIEVAETDVDRFVDAVSALEPTFGGINLEDIKAPECFMIEDRLRSKMNIPVFHDDQHGTAIIVGAAVRNGLQLAGKQIGEAKIVASGAGAAALACLNMLVSLGAKKENIWVTDIEGVVYEGREALMDEWKAVFAQKTDKAHAGRGYRRRRCFSRPVCSRGSQAPHGRENGQGPAGSGAGQSQSGDLAGRRQKGPRGRRHVHRALGLSEPGQQRPLLPLYFPGRAGCRRHDHQRAHETRRGGGNRGVWRKKNLPMLPPALTAARPKPSGPII